MTDAVAPPGVDRNTPSPARLYDHYLGGWHNVPADQDARDGVARECSYAGVAREPTGGTP